jgi:orotidine-5'-phosphate decarboxylase
VTRAERPAYRDRLAALVDERASRLCIGLDPSPEALELVGGTGRTRAQRGAAIERFGALLLDGAGAQAVAVKPQLAWYEAAGSDGVAALEATVERARDAGLLVVLDGKRGDIPHSAAAYADAWLGDDAASGVRGDALTVNASPGTDTLAAMAEVAHARGCELYALVLTSNPGAAALQAVAVAREGGSGGEPWWTLVAEAVTRCGVGAVVGATRPEAFGALRTALPTAPLLVPGVGVQGGSLDDLEALDAPLAPPSLVPVSRSLLADAGPGDQARSRDAIERAARALRAVPGGLREPSRAGVETAAGSGRIAT